MIKTIPKCTYLELMRKTLHNALGLVCAVEKILGTPSQKKHDHAGYTLYICFSILIHSIEEYGKLLYLKKLHPDQKGNYRIEYRKNKELNSKGYFTDHKYKINMAINDLKNSALNEANKNFIKQINWDARLNIFHTDINDDKNVTDITMNIDIEQFRCFVFDFKNCVLKFKIPDK